MSEGPAPGSRQSFQVAGVAAVVAAAVAFVATLSLWRRGGGGFDTAWLPSWNARLAFRLDGLGHGRRGRRVHLCQRLSAPAPGARGAAPGRGWPLPRPDGAVHGGHGGAVDRPGPAGAVRVLGPHGDRLLSAHRVRPPAPGGTAVGADGPAGHRGVGGAAADR